MEAKSDLDREGLRGPVKSYTTEHTFPTRTDAQGNVITEVHCVITTEFDSKGRNVEIRNRGSDGSTWIYRRTYDDSGRLMKEESGTEGQALTATAYSYDSQGRLRSIDGSQKTVSVRYYDHGRKTEIRIYRPEDYHPSVSSGLGPFRTLQELAITAGRGTATTIYDDQDRATEVQARNAAGEIIRRAIREYDAQGNMVDEHEILDRPDAIFRPRCFNRSPNSQAAMPKKCGRV